MTYQFSPSTGGFYETAFHDDIPADALYVTPSRYQELMDAQAAGATIGVSGDTGNPIIVAAIVPTLADKQELTGNAVKAEAASRIETVLPLYKQVNALRALVVDGTPLPAPVADAFATIDTIRAASETIEADVFTRPSAELDDYPVRDNQNWP